ncbi:uncharacterized protein LOC131237264 isoform X2 [Magnolia sinica]|uniref:uncharacterized protein LOC131237264 isoform X2 n=1 Tax=Magnolia sinica TaxID=86752 RepID=UPI00265966B8|nr:uncharacterized protein LOC131237264 isoform X2 [Magnolia sinica]
MSMLQSLNNVSLAGSILVSTLASPFTLAVHLLNLPKLYNLFAGILMSTFDMKDESKEVIWQDVGSGRNANTGKDNGANQSTDRGLTSTSTPVLQDIENKATIPTMRNGDDSWSLETSSGGLVNALLVLIDWIHVSLTWDRLLPKLEIICRKSTVIISLWPCHVIWTYYYIAK